MKKLEDKVVIEFTHDEASTIGHWIQWEFSTLDVAVYDAMKALMTLLLPESEQD